MSIFTRRRRRFRIAIGLLACTTALLGAVVLFDPAVLKLCAPLLLVSFASAGIAAWRTNDRNKTPEQYFEMILRMLRKPEEIDQYITLSAVILLVATAISCVSQ